MHDRPAAFAGRFEPVSISNESGASRFVLLCDHASNFLPPELASLGLPAAALDSHIAWDPGALPVARLLSRKLDAALVESRVSRLAIDCNRALDAPDLVPTISETTAIPGNENLSPAQREARIALSWQPFHQAVGGLVDERLKAGRETWLVSLHSFTPVYKGVGRPWQIGILHDDDVRLSAAMADALQRRGDIVVGDNQPYSPADRVYFTLERHARSRGLPCAMIEIRNDEIRDEAGQRKWGDLLAGILAQVEPTIDALQVAG
ncbi:N-formylglutamate amidohydrolase [Kumtagia ephedrae]|uniref:N-formylglutamate amidohydrolase n=1 Tax=Kumtagia ephedrae TaxID=2116701 RepID=A0A2P7S7D3_9HYPH|nr:N-formylglutamate amidohydrolase [Mesorhizobium ephedrae]PSJ58384.1 N-formylglutamate amidohydrolase [Mesorhizobium ephedrae]